jgi:hypothetical protein
MTIATITVIVVVVCTTMAVVAASATPPPPTTAELFSRYDAFVGASDALAATRARSEPHVLIGTNRAVDCADSVESRTASLIVYSIGTADAFSHTVVPAARNARTAWRVSAHYQSYTPDAAAWQRAGTQLFTEHARWHLRTARNAAESVRVAATRDPFRVLFETYHAQQADNATYAPEYDAFDRMHLRVLTGGAAAAAGDKTRVGLWPFGAQRDNSFGAWSIVDASTPAAGGCAFATVHVRARHHGSSDVEYLTFDRQRANADVYAHRASVPAAPLYLVPFAQLATFLRTCLCVSPALDQADM